MKWQPLLFAYKFSLVESFDTRFAPTAWSKKMLIPTCFAQLFVTLYPVLAVSERVIFADRGQETTIAVGELGNPQSRQNLSHCVPIAAMSHMTFNLHAFAICCKMS